jgi:hypothetical protein
MARVMGFGLSRVTHHYGRKSFGDDEWHDKAMTASSEMQVTCILGGGDNQEVENNLSWRQNEARDAWCGTRAVTSVAC